MIEQKQIVADFMTRLYERGLTTTFGGNISLRIPGDRILLTPSATDKGNMTADQIAVLGLDGSNFTPDLKPSGETSIHLSIFQHRPEVEAIVHAHPPTASLFTALEEKINTRILAEAYTFIGEPAVAPYALTGTPELAESVTAALGTKHQAVLMQNHGVLTVGRSLAEAFERMEVLENAAKMTIHARAFGSLKELSPQQCSELEAWAQHG